MAHDRKFRFGVQVSGLSAAGQNAHKYGAKDWQEMARKVEALGYSTLFMPDHFIDTELAPMVGIAFAAAATTRRSNRGAVVAMSALTTLCFGGSPDRFLLALALLAEAGNLHPRTTRSLSHMSA